MPVDSAIDRFLDAVAAAGVPRPQAPADVPELGEIDAAIAPLRLPAAARRLWERIDPETVRLDLFPDLCSPSFALEAWLAHEDEHSGMVPRPLFPLCYSSWNFVFVELHGAEDELGGTLFGWSYDGGDFDVSFDDVADWLDAHTRVIEAGAWRQPDAVPEISDDATIDGAIRLRRNGPHPIYGETTSLSGHAAEWPERWLELSELDPSDLERVTADENAGAGGLRRAWRRLRRRG